jgi:hypothetical protein
LDRHLKAAAEMVEMAAEMAEMAEMAAPGMAAAVLGMVVPRMVVLRMAGGLSRPSP